MRNSQIYIRKVNSNQLLDKQVSITDGVHHLFFDDKMDLRFVGKKSKKEYNVRVLPATDKRFSNEIKNLINDEGGMEIDDLIVISKYMDYYELEMIKKGDNKYLGLDYTFELGNDKHALIIDEIDQKVIELSNVKFKRNRIVFGAPGTGKSFKLNNEKDQLIQSEEQYERVTFHPDYTYANFVGTYKPVMVTNKDNEKGSDISYEYVPGPFMRLFVKALMNPDKPHLLLIEEINRANVAAVFGDLFQLLDRDDNEESEYPVEASEDIKQYLQKYGIDKNKIKIPNNMFIWATMNSADQGVFPMDTAFKRRWDFDYIGINNNESQIENIKFNISVTNKNDSTKPMPIYWNALRKSINKYLSDNKINEDKQLGAYFISKKILNSGSDEDFISTFKNKVIMYLFEDAAKQKRMDMFAGSSSKGFDANRYSEICECFDKFGVECFNKTIETDYILRISNKE